MLTLWREVGRGRRQAAMAACLFGMAACASDATPAAPEETGTPSAMVREGLSLSTPEAEGISATAMATLIADAKAEQSDALIVLRNGKLVYENYFGQADAPIVAMSASKSFVGLAYGFLLADGKLASLDERVTKVHPTFADVDPRKATMTYRHLLSQTSGIDPLRAGSTVGDIEARGLAAKTLFPPGTGWQYSNGGVDFLADLAGHLAGKPMDQYLNEKLFAPMGITTVAWYHDPRGVPLGAGEMMIRPLDLAKVGQLILDGGSWKGQQILPAGWMTASTQSSSTMGPNYGLLWWRVVWTTQIGITSELLTQWRWMGVADSTVAKLQSIADRPYNSTPTLYQDVRAQLTGTEYDILMNMETGDHFPATRPMNTTFVDGFSAEGYLGQYLVIYPSKNLVVVRMRRQRQSEVGTLSTVNTFPKFYSDTYRLIP